MVSAMIEVQDLSKSFGSVRALGGVSFTIPRGQVVGLLGPNGAGKTTSMRILTGYLAPTTGTALIDGQDVVEEPIACQRRIGYLPEGNPLYSDLRIMEALNFSAKMHGIPGPSRRAAILETVQAAGLSGMEHRLIGTISKGFRQRVGLAQALLHKPDILILDEPTSGLDPNQQEEMRTLIRDLGREHTVILSTHILPEVEAVCDRVLIIDAGELVADGTVGEIRRRASGLPTALVTVRADPELAEATFRDLDFVVRTHAVSLPEEAGVVEVAVEADGAIDRNHLETLAAAAHARGLPLSGLIATSATLEDVFA